MFELRETGDWDIFLGPLERPRAETGGADHWMLKRRECLGFARVNKSTSESLGYPLSVFNKNSTLKGATKPNGRPHRALQTEVEKPSNKNPMILMKARGFHALLAHHPYQNGK